MAIIEVVSGGDRQSLFKRFMHKSKVQAISELVDIHLLHCSRIETLEQRVKELEAALAQPSPVPTEGFTHFPELLESVQQMDAMLKANSAQAEARCAMTEQPEVVATLEPFTYDDPDGACYIELRKNLTNRDAIEGDDRLMLVSQHERIVGALRFERQQMDRAFTACINERDAAQARIAELETQKPVARMKDLLKRISKRKGS